MGVEKKKPIAADTAEAANRIRLNEQEFLLENMDLLTARRFGADVAKRPLKQFDHLIPINMLSSEIENYRNRVTGAESFLNATTQELSALIPSIKMYMPMVDGKGKLQDELIYFGNYIKGDRKVVKDYKSSSKEKGITSASFLESAQGRAVGLKSFTYEQHTNHPGEKSMTAEVEIFFQSISDLASGPYVELLVPIMDPDSPRPTMAKDASTEEKTRRINELKMEQKAILAKMAAKSRGPTVSPAASRMKAIIGWATTTTDGSSSSRRTKEIQKFVKGSQEVIILEMTKYNLTFGAEGQATLKISYVARSDSAFSGPGYNILTGGPKPAATKIPGSMLEPGGNKRMWKDLAPGSYILKTLSKQSGEWGKEDRERIVYRLYAKKVRLDVHYHRIGVEIAKLEEKKGELENAEKFLKNASAIAAKVSSYTTGWRYAALLKALDESNKIYGLRVHSIYLGIRGSGDKRSVGERKRFKVSTAGGRSRRESRMKTSGAARIHHKVQSVAKQGDPEKRKEGMENLNKNHLSTLGRSTPGDNTTLVRYMFLGDIIDKVFGLADNSVDNKKGLMLGNLMIPELASGLPQAAYNIAEIPISLVSFETWFLDRIVKPQRSSYPLREFIGDLLKLLVEPALNSDTLAAPRKPANATGYSFYQSSFSTPTKFKKGTRYHKNDKEFKDAPRERTMPERTSQYDYNDHIIILSREGFSGTGDYDGDLDRGIYHLILGANRGLVKSFSFTQQENKYMHAINMAGASTGNKISVLAIPQDATITLVGNTLFKQGSLVFINAEFGLGRDVARKLKIGGYYFIAKVTHEISADKYNTKLKCIWQNDYQDKAKDKSDGVKSSPTSAGK